MSIRDSDRTPSGKIPFTAKFPCPICGGFDGNGSKRHQGTRCWGYLSSDHEYAHCTREDHPANKTLPLEPKSETFAHWLAGPCKCGHSHGSHIMEPSPLPPVRFSPVPAHTPRVCLEWAFPNAGELTAMWLYPNAKGKPHAAVGRFDHPQDGKTYRPCHVEQDCWIPRDPAGLWPLYRLPNLGSETQILVFEGEKCVNLACKIGFEGATTSAHGNYSAHRTDWTPLAGKSVAIFPDADQAGEDYAQKVADILLALGCTVRIVRLPGLGKAEDIEQWIDRELVHEFLPEGIDDPTLQEKLQNLINTAEVLGPPRWATLADVRAVAASADWTWKGWFPQRRPVAIGAHPGVGKTRVMLQLIHSVFHGHPWPDGSPCLLPPGMPALYLCADSQQDELASIANSMGLPDAALILPTRSTDPYGTTDLDDSAALALIEAAIAEIKPWCVVVDSLTYATSNNLCDQTHMKRFRQLFNDWCQKHDLNVFLLCHLSTDGHLLGRRLAGIVRVDVRLECPQPDHSERLVMLVEKTWAKKPDPLGVTIGGDRITFDNDPPPRATKNGHAPRKTTVKPEIAAAWISARLSEHNDQYAKDLLENWIVQREINDHVSEPDSASRIFWNAKNHLVESGTITSDGGTGTGRPMVLHLVTQPDATDQSQPADPIDWTRNP
jgi:hypothetical protein